MTDNVKPVTKKQLRQTLAEAAGITIGQVDQVLDALSTTIISEVNATGTFTLMNLCKIVKVVKAARPEQQKKSPFNGEMMTVKAKPAFNSVRIRPLKNLKEAIV